MRDSLRTGGTDLATEGGLLGGAFEDALGTGLVGLAGVLLSSLYGFRVVNLGNTFRATGAFSTRESLSRTSRYRSP
jgi:uncharacterized membrane protein YjjP (DUF1212 family)